MKAVYEFAPSSSEEMALEEGQVCHPPPSTQCVSHNSSPHPLTTHNSSKELATGNPIGSFPNVIGITSYSMWD